MLYCDKSLDESIIVYASKKFGMFPETFFVGDRRNLISTYLNEFWNSLQFKYIKNESKFDDLKFFKRNFL